MIKRLLIKLFPCDACESKELKIKELNEDLKDIKFRLSACTDQLFANKVIEYNDPQCTRKDRYCNYLTKSYEDKNKTLYKENKELHRIINELRDQIAKRS